MILCLSLLGFTIKHYNYVVAIDIGSTYTCASVYKDGKVKILEDEFENQLVNSIFSFDDYRVGKYAKEQMILKPNKVTYSVNRFLGRYFNDTDIKDDINNYNVKIVNYRDYPYFDFNNNGENIISPEAVFSQFMKKMNNIAKQNLDRFEYYDTIVITVPQYFNVNQYNSIRKSASIAGVRIFGMITEPEAAILAYELNKNISETKKVMVIHLGGSTFEVSLFLIENSEIKMIESKSDIHFGGENFDNTVTDYFLDVFKNCTGKDASNDIKAILKLKYEVEKAKQVLSYANETIISIRIKWFLIMLEKIGNIAYNIDINEKGR